MSLSSKNQEVQLNDAAIRVLESRYLIRDEDGKILEDATGLFSRVAHAIAAVETKWDSKGGARKVQEFEKKFFKLMTSLRFIPNSPTLLNAGRKNGQLAACFVLPIEDSLESVFETLKNAAIIHKSGGGTGFSFGRLRPKGAPIRGSGGKAAGPVAILKIFDLATDVVKQGGARRGANMAILPVEHADIEEFIASKLDGGITNFNISVGMTDAFMKRVKKRDKSALKLWNKIIDAAWSTGDPGVVFLDAIERANPTPTIGRMESTNPCGEQPLLPNESCNLGSINLLAYVKNRKLDWKELERDIALSVRFLDNVIEANTYPLDAIKKITYANRKIGLGIMGWADTLIALGIPYDSKGALTFAEKTMSHFYSVAVKASEQLAQERGAFPNFTESLWADRGERPRRNATVTTIAPTGTIAIIAGVSSGIEPIFSLAYERTALEGQKLIFIHPSLGTLSKHAVKRILRDGSVQQISDLSSGQKKVFKTAHEISPENHVKMQAIFQKYSESAVSKTINMPNSAKRADIARVYELAHALKCKGITIYRDRSKTAQVLSKGIR